MVKRYCFWIALLFSEVVWARNLELDLDIGRVQEAGDLSSTSSAGPLGGLTALMWLNRGEVLSTAMGGYAMALSLNFSGMHLKQGATEFPFASDKEFSLFRSVFMVNPCFLTDHRVQVCAGIGWQMLSLAQTNYEQTYGSGIWQLEARADLAPTWVAGVRSSYCKIDQEINGTKSFFELWTNSLFLGYSGW